MSTPADGVGTVTPAGLPLWRNRDYAVLWTGQLVSALGTSMTNFVFPIVAFAITGSTTQAALVSTARFLGSTACQLPAGALVDRWNRRAVMAIADLGAFVLYGSVVFAAFTHRLDLPWLVVVALLTGVAAAFYMPAETAAIRAVVSTEQLPTAISQNQARQSAASLIGPPVAGALLALSRALPFLVDAVSYGLSAVAVLALRTPLPAPRRDADAPTRLRTEMREGISFLLSRAFFRACLAFAVAVNFAAAALMLVLVLKLLKEGTSPAALGGMEAASAVAGLAGALASPWLMRRVAGGVLVLVPCLVLVVALVGLAFTGHVVAAAAWLVVISLGLPVANTCLFAYLIAVTPDALQGRVQSGLIFAATLLQPAGPVVGGALLAALGGTWSMLVLAALAAVGAIPLVLSRDVRRLPRADQWSAA